MRGAVVMLLPLWHDAMAALSLSLFGAARGPFVQISSALVPALVGAGLCLACILSYLRLRYPAGSWRRHVPALRPGLVALWTGLLGFGAGYLALAVTDNPPSLDVISSRVNAAAAIGAAAVLIGSLWLLCHAFPWPRRIGRLLFLAGSVWLVGAASAHAEQVAGAYASAWKTQQHAWTSLISAAPSFKPHTTVLFMEPDLPGWDLLTALPPWAVQGAIPLLYSGTGTGADSIPRWEVAGACAGGLAQLRRPIGFRLGLTDRGVLTHDGTMVPWTDVLAVRYSPGAGGRITILRGPSPLAAPGCYIHSNPERISLRSPLPSPWRHLVANR